MTILGLVGCQLFVDDADREVYRLIEERQQDALDQTRDTAITEPETPLAIEESAYDFVPRPIDSEVPAAFQRPTTRPADQAYRRAVGRTDVALEQPTTQPATTFPTDERVNAPGIPPDMPPTRPTATQPAAEPAEHETTNRPVLELDEALAYAFSHSREFQFAKEDLYLQALALSLERHLWTPRLRGEIEAQYANYGQIRDFDHAMAAVASVGVEQRLPYGGEVTAQILGSLMRDLTNHVTTAETGAVILEANIPLLRGAGRVAYEPRYQSERDLIYAVRTFERFRRSLAVRIAGEYFNLQQLRQQIINARESLEAFEQDVARAEALWRTGRLIRLDVFRADQRRLEAANTEVAAIERYESALDSFKILLGMPVDTEIDVALAGEFGALATAEAKPMHAETLVDVLRMPEITEAEAVRTALKYRLDLLTVFDAIADAKRGVKIAENGLLPDLNASGTLQLDTDPDSLGTLKYNTERATWRGFLTLELPLDRKAERNALRAAQIEKRRAERGYEEARDQVRLEVRRAIRQVALSQELLAINRRNRDQAVTRREFAQVRFELGQINNRDVVEAQDELLGAQNRLAAAQAGYWLAILEFRLSTGTLRIDDQGRWSNPVAVADSKQ